MPTINQLTTKKGSRKHSKRKGSRSRALKCCPQRKGYCTRVTTMKPKKPNSAIRKIAKVKMTTVRKVFCYIPGRGHNLREYSHVLVRGGYVPDLPGIQYHLMRGKFDFNWKERIVRIRKRSKYGCPSQKTIDRLNAILL